MDTMSVPAFRASLSQQAGCSSHRGRHPEERTHGWGLVGTAATAAGPQRKDTGPLWKCVRAGQGPRAIALLPLEPMSSEQEEETGEKSKDLEPLLSWSLNS